MVGDVAHLLLGLSLVLAQLFPGLEVPRAAIADKCRWVVALMLLHNMLPVLG